MLETHSSNSKSTSSTNDSGTNINLESIASNSTNPLDDSAANSTNSLDASAAIVPLILSFLPTPPVESSGKIKRNRCGICQKKLYVNSFPCKCDSTLVFCSTHRFPYAHNCTISNLSLHQQQIQRQNPVVKPDKFNRI